MSVKVLNKRRVDLLSLINNCHQNFRYTHGWMRFGRLKAFNSINIYCALWTGKNQILKTRTTNMESGTRELWPFFFKMPMDETGNFFLPINIVTLTFVDFFKEPISSISSNISETHT